jgi:hypothetical protein
MKNTVSKWTLAITFVGALGLASAYATPARSTKHKSPVEITGCLQPGPVSKEYLLEASDGTTWGINEADLMMNNYVGQTVTVAGDAIHPTASERKAGGAQHFLKAMDLVVDSESCQK